jgi:hypothetical protein
MPIEYPYRSKITQCYEVEGQSICHEIFHFRSLFGPTEEELVTRPQPTPWRITVDGLEPSWAKDLELVAHIDAMARQLSPEVQNDLLEGLERATHKLRAQLPRGVTVHVG